jgi:hypothetical protein
VEEEAAEEEEEQLERRAGRAGGPRGRRREQQPTAGIGVGRAPEYLERVEVRRGRLFAARRRLRRVESNGFLW